MGTMIAGRSGGIRTSDSAPHRSNRRGNPLIRIASAMDNFMSQVGQKVVHIMGEWISIVSHGVRISEALESFQGQAKDQSLLAEASARWPTPNGWQIRSADWQSAVSQVGNLPAWTRETRLGAFRRPLTPSRRYSAARLSRNPRLWSAPVLGRSGVRTAGGFR